MTHAKVLEETKLWQVYTEKVGNDYARIGWTKEVYSSACEQLKAVRDTFDNYTLHDETHVLNVQDAMSGLLGNRIMELTAGEAELLILVAALHDIGMVYTEKERELCLTDKTKLCDYYYHHPDLRDIVPANWNESAQQDYLRWLHPLRVGEVLQRQEWRKLFNNRPKETATEEVIIAVCCSHGESPDRIRHRVAEPNGALQYLRYKDIDPLFCSILLRLADIMDFDDSRAPSALFAYSGRSAKSVEEWKKHMSSMGFNFPSTPSLNDLPYGASFSNPSVERAARTFLDWIDEELSVCRGLLPLASSRWNNFPFPYQVNRSEIERIGYDFGDFQISMDQHQIMDLLVGENLYSDRSVFVRELLQNSVDATMLRAEMDSAFAVKLSTDEARIDLWEWWDDDGDLWFRIDDHGIGMTRGMLEKYFLKAGNSYYNSQELKKELNGKKYSSISRFGIGFLSCFLCGIEAYVSTTYWNPEKNIREAEQEARKNAGQTAFGLRLDVTGLTGYYTLRNQAITDNRPDPLPAPPDSLPHPDPNEDNGGYRAFPGTSIAIRLDSGKLGSTSLLDVAKHWTCFPQMPVYYNDMRICMTQDELVTLAKEEQGVQEYELSDEEKLRFDAFIPEFAGKYPKIKETIDFFDAEQVPGLPNLKLLFCETRVMIPEDQGLHRGGYIYSYTGRSPLHRPQITIYYAGVNREDIVLSFQSKDRRQLLNVLSDNSDFSSSMHYGWKGVFAYHEGLSIFKDYPTVLIIDGDEEKPAMKANRELLVSLPLKTAITANIWLEKHSYETNHNIGSSFYNTLLKEWRAITSPEFKEWICVSSFERYQAFKKALEEGISPDKKLPNILSAYDADSKYIWKTRNHNDLRWFFLAYLQLNYQIAVDYSNQKLKFSGLDSVETQFDLFPPMPFCYGKTEKDCSFLCSADSNLRFAITANHPFADWLIKNANLLYKHYPRQFEQIVYGLQVSNADQLIATIDQIMEQLTKTAFQHGIDMSKCPKLTISDFWAP